MIEYHVKALRKIPEDIRPETELTRIDILAWGLRDLLKYHLQSVDTPSIQFECDGIVAETSKLQLKNSPNFEDRVRTIEVHVYIHCNRSLLSRSTSRRKKSTCHLLIFVCMITVSLVGSHWLACIRSTFCDFTSTVPSAASLLLLTSVVVLVWKCQVVRSC